MKCNRRQLEIGSQKSDWRKCFLNTRNIFANTHKCGESRFSSFVVQRKSVAIQRDNATSVMDTFAPRMII